MIEIFEIFAVIFFLSVVFIIHFLTKIENDHMKERHERMDKQIEMLEDALDRQKASIDKLGNAIHGDQSIPQADISPYS